MPNPTLLDIAKSQGSEGLAALVEEVQTYSPEVMMGATRPIVGISYKQNVRTNLPQGSFRNANEGTAASKSTWEERLFNCFIANPNQSKRFLGARSQLLPGIEVKEAHEGRFCCSLPRCGTQSSDRSFHRRRLAGRKVSDEKSRTRVAGLILGDRGAGSTF